MARPSYLSHLPSIEALAYALSGKSDLSVVELADWSAVVRKKYENIPTVRWFSCPVGWIPFVISFSVDDVPDFIDKKSSHELASVRYDPSLKKITLVNDVENAGANKVYAQNADGVKGWYDWETVFTQGGGEQPTLGNHNLLSSTHSDTVPEPPEKNALIVGAEGKWWKLSPPQKKRVLLYNSGKVVWGVIPTKFSIEEGDPWPRLVTVNGVPSSDWDEGRYYYGTNKEGKLGFWNFAKVECDEKPKPEPGKPDPKPPGEPGAPVEPMEQCECGECSGDNRRSVILSPHNVVYYFVCECSNENFDADSINRVIGTATLRIATGQNCAQLTDIIGTGTIDLKPRLAFGKVGNKIVITIAGEASHNSWINVPNNGMLIADIEIMAYCGGEKRSLVMIGRDCLLKDNEGNPKPPDDCEGFSHIIESMYIRNDNRIVLKVSFNRYLAQHVSVVASGKVACQGGRIADILLSSAPIANPNETRALLLGPSPHDIGLDDSTTCRVCILAVTAICAADNTERTNRENVCFTLSGNNDENNPARPFPNPGDGPGNPIDGIGPLGPGGGDGAGPIFPGQDGEIEGAGGDGAAGGGINNPEQLPLPGGAPAGEGIVPEELADPKKWPAPVVKAGGRANVKVIRESLKIKLPWFKPTKNFRVITFKFGGQESDWRARLPNDLSYDKGSFTVKLDNDTVSVLPPKETSPLNHHDYDWVYPYMRNSRALRDIKDKPAFSYYGAPAGKLSVSLGKKVGYVTVCVSLSIPKDTLKDFKFGTVDNPLVKRAVEGQGIQGAVRYVVAISGLCFLAVIRFHGGATVRTLLNARRVTATSTDGKALTAVGSLPSTYFFNILLPYHEGVSKEMLGVFEIDNRDYAYGIQGAGFTTFGLNPSGFQVVYDKNLRFNEDVNNDRVKRIKFSPSIYTEAGEGQPAFNQIEEITIMPVMLFIRGDPMTPTPGYRCLDTINPNENNISPVTPIELDDDNSQPKRMVGVVDDEIPLIGVSVESTLNSLLHIFNNPPMLIDNVLDLYRVPLDYIHPKTGADAEIKGKAPEITINYLIRAVYM